MGPLSMSSLVVDDTGTQLSFFDSGVPVHAPLDAPYTTIFTLHGMGFSSRTSASVVSYRLTH